MYTANGSTSVSALRPVVSVTRAVIHRATNATTTPIATAPTTPSTNRSTSVGAETAPPDTVASTAVWNTTSAVASLKRPSLCSTESSLRGIRTGPATASTATGSGGATIAPRAMAAEIPIPGTSAAAVPATAATVATTSATARNAMLRHRARNNAHDVRWAAAKSSGGRNSGRISSGSRSKRSGRPGANATPTPSRSISAGHGSRSRSPTPTSNTAASISPTTRTRVSTGRQRVRQGAAHRRTVRESRLGVSKAGTRPRRGSGQAASASGP